MRKNRTMRVAALLLALTLITSCFVGGTFAKYTSTTSGNDSARVAKWEIVYKDNVNNSEVDITGTDTVTFDLFKTVADDADAASKTDDANVMDGKIIAPGTAGSFELEVVNNSEVNATYTIALAESNDDGIFIQYSLDKTNWKDDFEDINKDAVNTKDVAINMNGGSKIVTVYWRWVFEGTTAGAHAGQDDVEDTKLGIAAQEAGKEPKVTITATITATQVD